MREEGRPDTWELRVDIAPDPVTGRRRRKSRTVTGSERQASKELARMVVGVGGRDVADAEPPQHHTRDPVAPSPQAIRDLLAHACAIDPALAAYLRVSATLGTRRGETLAIKWSDVLDDAIVIDRALTDVPDGKGVTVKATKTHASVRSPWTPPRW